MALRRRLLISSWAQLRTLVDTSRTLRVSSRCDVMLTRVPVVYWHAETLSASLRVRLPAAFYSVPCGPSPLFPGLPHYCSFSTPWGLCVIVAYRGSPADPFATVVLREVDVLDPGAHFCKSRAVVSEYVQVARISLTLVPVPAPFPGIVDLVRSGARSVSPRRVIGALDRAWVRHVLGPALRHARVPGRTLRH
jgi:hypothetical protein